MKCKDGFTCSLLIYLLGSPNKKSLKQYFQPVFGAGPSQHSHYLDSKRTHNMREGRESQSIGFSRRLTNGESNPFTLVQWEKRDVTMTNWQDDSIVFEQRT